ncbi:sodium ion transport [Balamuthia mandrillaris]
MTDAASKEPLAYLLKAPSKKAVNELFVASFKCRKDNPLPAQLVEATGRAFKLEQQQALRLLTAIRELIAAAVYDAEATLQAVAELLPSSLHSELAKLISTIVAHHLPQWRKEAIANQISLPKYRDVDWRIDLKSASERARMNAPTVLVQLKVEATPTVVGETPSLQNVTFELDSATLETMLEGLGKIRDQLETISSGTSST